MLLWEIFVIAGHAERIITGVCVSLVWFMDNIFIGHISTLCMLIALSSR